MLRLKLSIAETTVLTKSACVSLAHFDDRDIKAYGPSGKTIIKTITNVQERNNGCYGYDSRKHPPIPFETKESVEKKGTYTTYITIIITIIMIVSIIIIIIIIVIIIRTNINF